MGKHHLCSTHLPNLPSSRLNIKHRREVTMLIARILQKEHCLINSRCLGWEEVIRSHFIPMGMSSTIVCQIVIILNTLTLGWFDIDEWNLIIHITRYRLLAKVTKVRYLEVVPIYAKPLKLVPYAQHLLSLTVTHPLLHLHHLLVLITGNVNAIDSLLGIGDEFAKITAILPFTYTHSHTRRESQAKAGA